MCVHLRRASVAPSRHSSRHSTIRRRVGHAGLWAYDSCGAWALYSGRLRVSVSAATRLTSVDGWWTAAARRPACCYPGPERSRRPRSPAGAGLGRRPGPWTSTAPATRLGWSAGAAGCRLAVSLQSGRPSPGRPHQPPPRVSSHRPTAVPMVPGPLPVAVSPGPGEVPGHGVRCPGCPGCPGYRGDLISAVRRRGSGMML